MPDWMSHLIIGLIIAELFSIRKKSLVIFGALVPDILSKIHLAYFYLGIPEIVIFNSFHTPIMVFLFSLLIAPLFMYDKIKTVLFFNIGGMSHFLTDLTMKHFVIIGSRLLFPFSNKNYTFNLVWPEQSLYILIGSLIVYLTIRFVKKHLCVRKLKLLK